MKITEQHCPRCKQKRIDKPNRRCTNCHQVLLFPGDDGQAFQQDEWFMWLPRGPRGSGWYRKELFKQSPQLWLPSNYRL